MTIFAAPRFKGASRFNGGLFQSATIAAAMASGLVSGPHAHAQEASASSGQLEEIVVTARATAEKEVAVPISVQTFSENQLREENITDLGSLQFLAGFTFQNATSTAAGGREFPSLICRGLQSTYGGGFQDSCALFVDGNYVSAGIASITTSDVAQVEVLKGPQNVYFGKNTFGGAINFITAKPTDYFGGQIDASVTGRGSNKIDATLEGPLVAGILDGRIEFENYNKAAQYMASDGGQLGAERSTSVTTALAFTPSDDLLVRFRGHYQQDNDSAADTGFLPGTQFGTNCEGGNATTSGGVHVPIHLSGPYFCGTIPSLAQTGTGVLDVNTTIPAPFAQSLAANNFSGTRDPILAEAPSLGHSGLRRNLLQLGAQATYDLPSDAVLAFNGGYNSSQSLDIWDLDRSTNQIYINAQPILSHDLTLDARVTSDQSASLRGVVGANYFRSSYASDQDDDNFYNYAAIPFYSGTSVQTGNYINEDDSIWALYGSVDYDIIDSLTVTAEARYQHDVVTDYTYGAAGSYSKSFNNILPRAIIKYHPEPDWNFYASWSEGVQPAQLQTSYISATAPQRAYLAKYFPDVNYFTPLPKLYSWEIGAKQRLFDNKLQYGIALYDEHWDHQQTSTALFNPVGCGATQLTAACPLSTGGIGLNLSDTAQIRGVEFNFAAQLLPQLTVDGSIDYKHAVWLDYFNSTYAAFTGGATNFNGNAIARVPDLTGSFQAIWRDHLVGDWDYYVRGQMTYQGGMYESDIDIGRTASFERVNGSIGVQEGDLTLELYVINLTNDKNWDWASRVPELENAADLFVGGYEEFQGVLVGAPDKRDFGFKVHYKFGAPEAASVAPAAYVPPPVQTAKPATTARSYMVFFDFNKSDLTSQAVSIVDQAAANAGPAKVTQLVVTGHTDTVGSDAYNMRLSRRRAESVAAELEKKGIPSSEIEIVAKGKKDLLVPTADGVREPQNRRVQIVYEGGATS